MLKSLLSAFSRRVMGARGTAHLPRGGAPEQATPGRLDQARACMRGRDYEGAKRICRELIAHPASAAAAWELLGAIALEQGEDEDAYLGFEAALEEAEPTPQMLANTAETARRTDRHARAMALCDRALELQPGYAPALHIRALTLQSCWRMDEARSLLERLVAQQPGFEKGQSSYLFLLNHVGADPLLVQEEHRRWAAIHAEPLSQAHVFVNNRATERRLRVGYVSGDFCDHAASHFIQAILEQHDPAALEVYCFSSTGKIDATTERLRRHAHHWRDIRWMADAEATAAIRADAIDILVDLSGHTRANRLRVFARRAAPVQVTYLGYPATTGMSAMDYRITDACADPPGRSEHAYCETLLRMPASMWCFQPPQGMPEPGVMPAAAPGAGITFGSLNSMLKLTPRVVANWARILLALPSSRLILATVPEGEARARLTGAFAAHGIAASALEFIGRVPREQFWALHQRIDIAFDSFPCNGGATTCETLWLGVPVVTLASNMFQSRAGLSLLTCVGLSGLVAQSNEDYVRIACELAADTAALAQLRAGMRRRMLASPLMDARAFVRALEGHYRDIWRRWCTANH
jgi:predicted O-linked N-acetylglucosamine transferase (SPINDLY family)